MFIPDPDFYYLSIPDPGSNNNKRGEKICCLIFFSQPQDLTILKIILFLNRYKKNLSQLAKNYKYLLSKRIVISSQKYVLGARDQEKTYPGSAKLDPEHLRSRRMVFTSEEGSLPLLLNHLSYPECLLSAEHTEDDNMTDDAHPILFTDTYSYRITQCCGTITVLVPTIERYGSDSVFRKVMVPVPPFDKLRFRFQLHIQTINSKFFQNFLEKILPFYMASFITRKTFITFIKFIVKCK